MPDFIDSLPRILLLNTMCFADAPVHSWGFTTSLAELKNKEKPTISNNMSIFHTKYTSGVDANGSTQYERVKMLWKNRQALHRPIILKI